MEKVILKATDISKEYTDSTGFRIELYKGLTFDIEKGKITTFLAPTGSGKTSLIRMISGLEEVSGGKVETPENTTRVLIPSEPSSYPWLNVKENIELVAGKENISETIKQVGLEGYEDFSPANISYGFRFRVSLARALAGNFGIVCIDESFSAMNAVTKKDLYKLVRKVVKDTNKTFVVATTDISEAILLSDIIYIMSPHPGKITDRIVTEMPEQREKSVVKESDYARLRTRIEESIQKHNPGLPVTFSI